MPKKVRSKTYKWNVSVVFSTKDIYAFCVELFHSNVAESHSLRGAYDRYSMRNSFDAYSDAVEWAEQVKDVILENVPRDKCQLGITLGLEAEYVDDDDDDDED